MQQIRLTLLCCFSLIIACSKNSKNDAFNGSGTGIGVVKPVGTPHEAAKTTVIGADGGSLVSRDGKFEIAIPAGALPANTTVGVAAITSTSDAALGTSYRVTSSVQFAKAVTVTISYADYTDSIRGGCGAGIGHQDSNGVWQLKAGRVVHESKGTVSINTEQVGDWALLAPMRLIPAYSLIAPGEEVILKVVSYIPIGAGVDPCDLLSGSGKDIPVEELYVVPDEGIDKWVSLAGESEGSGKLTRLSRGASFKASNHDDPAINPVTILAFFHRSVVPLSATIQIRPVTLGVYITVGNTTYVYSKASAYGAPGDNGIEWEKDDGGLTYHGSMNWRQHGTGVRAWSDDNQFLWEPERTSPRLVYQSYWDDGLRISSGSINISQFGNVGEIVEGTFIIDNAGQYKAATATTDIEYIGIKPISGRFRVIRK